MLFQAEIVRVVGAHHGDEYVFAQKKMDRRRYATYTLKGQQEWPGVAVPAEWAETPPLWELEPMPNGNALVRCRRLKFLTPITGIFVGSTRTAEGTLRETETDDKRPWRRNELEDLRWLDLYEIATAPTQRGRGRLVLVHPLDATVIPASITP